MMTLSYQSSRTTDVENFNHQVIGIVGNRMNNARLFRVFPDFSEIFLKIQHDNIDLIVCASCMIIADVFDTAIQHRASFHAST